MQPEQPPSRQNQDRQTAHLDDLHFTFIRNVQHELRTPLSVIQGYVELLHAGDLGALAPEQQQALYTIVDHVHELRTLVDRINTLMAVEAHAIANLPVGLGETVADVVEERRNEATQAELALEVHLEPDLPLIVGDPYQIQQVADCLLENALKFTPKGGHITVQAYAEPGWCCLTVADTGKGMTEEEIERVLSTRFSQADSSTTRWHGGLGVGLTLVRAVTKEHGGRFEVESRPEQGTRFTVKFPVLTSPAGMESRVEDTVPVRRILIVDDEQAVALTFQAGLEKLPNCETTVATSGEEALRLFAQHPFDLLITDYKMPGTDGMTLATQVRELYPPTVIIMVTAYGDEDLQEQAARASIRRILDKPVSLEEIRQVILEAFDQSED